jgi:hypothetical protein
MAYWSGVWEDVAKLTAEKGTPPVETSGTPEMVVLEPSQVMRSWSCAAMSAVSLGRTASPMM